MRTRRSKRWSRPFSNNKTDVRSQERKKAVKEEAREKRKHKMPKAEKKRRIKATKT